MDTLLQTESTAPRRAARSRADAPRTPSGGDRWEQRFADLAAFKSAHGHCNVPSNYAEDPSLAVWVFNCRRQQKLGTLAAERIARLDAIGFSWTVRKRRFVARDWDAMIAQLENFRREHGHVSVPNGSPEHRELAAWLHGVRCNKRAERLDDARVRQLEALGVVWEPQHARWERMFAALAEYRRQHGDCNVPGGWPDGRELASWVKGVRAAQKRGDLDAERIARLEAIGFAWERIGEGRWEEMYVELAEFRRGHGHCRISTLSQEHRTLGNWVHTQRRLRKQDQLETERIARLDALGFIWDQRRESWETMFAVLDEFRGASGHCDVPQAYAPNRKLGNWVMMQRAAYKAGKLQSDQIERLQAIGFRFSILGDRLLVAQPDKSRPAARPDERRAA